MQPSNPITPETLLENASWMRSLARGLLGDPHEADDVVQEASMAALSSPPAASVSPRAWLGRVVRNAAWRKLRTRARREAREERAARPESQPPSQAESLERLELQEVLLKAVRQLDEPFRTTVVQRHFEGLSSAEIARSAGVPEGTVRWRLKRGLDLLRERLDGHVGRESWALLLAPLALRDALPPALATGAASGGTATSTWILQGVIAMGTWKLLAAASMVGVAAWTLWMRADAPPEAGSELELVAAATPAAAPAAPQPVEPSAGEPRAEVVETAAAQVPAPASSGAVTQEPAAAIARATLVVRFVDELGAPWPGVRCEQVSAHGAEGDSAPGPHATSAVDGRVSMQLALPRYLLGGPDEPRWQHRFRVSCPGRATLLIPAYVTAGQTTDLGDVVVPPGASASGRVVDELGNALAGALVGPAPAELEDDDGTLVRQGCDAFDADLAVRSAADGGFVLEGVPIGQARIWAHASGRRYGWSDVFAVAAGTSTSGHELVLAPLEAQERVAGRVFDAQGAPAAHAHLEVVERSQSGVGVTFANCDADGSFELVLKQHGATLDISAQTQVNNHRASAQGIPAGTLDLELHLGAPSELLVRLVEFDGSPVRSATFDISSGYMSSTVDATEREAGVYLVPHPDVSFRIEAQADGFRTTTEGPLLPGSLPAELELVMLRTPRVQGLVLADGAPVADARVEVREHIPAANMTVNGLRCVQSSFPAASGRTDAQGRFELDLDLDGSFWVRVEANGWAPSEAGPFEVAYIEGSQEVELELDRGGVIEGYLLLPPGEKTDGRFVAVSHGDGAARTQRLGADGHYRFEGLASGSWQVLEVSEEIGQNSTSYSSYSGSDPIEWSCSVRAGRTTRHDVDRSQP